MSRKFSTVVDRRWWVAINTSVGVFISTLDASVINISVPTITQALNTNLKAVASGFLSISRNLGIVIGIAFAEMIIAFRSVATPLERGVPSLASI